MAQRHQFTVLHEIVLKLSTIPLRSQLEHSTANINAQASLGETALQFAIVRRDLESMIILVGHGARIDLHDKAGWNPIHLACQFFPEGLSLLLGVASKIDIVQPNITKALAEARTGAGLTPVIIASINDHTGMAVALLLDRSAAPNDYTVAGNPILYAV